MSKNQINQLELPQHQQIKLMKNLNKSAVQLSLNAVNGVTKAYTDAKFSLVLEYKPMHIQPYNVKQNIYALLFKLVPTVKKTSKVRNNKKIIKKTTKV